jgi:hypothetical protein
MRLGQGEIILFKIMSYKRVALDPCIGGIRRFVTTGWDVPPTCDVVSDSELRPGPAMD